MLEYIKQAPDYCLITGMKKVTSYLIENNIVYMSDTSYLVFTLPAYDKVTQKFYSYAYNIEERYSKSKVEITSLSYLESTNHPHLDEIKKIYKID